LGNVYPQLGEPRRAIEHYAQRLAIAREIGDRQGEGAALGSLGIAYAQLGEPRRAIEHLEQSLKIAREIGDRRVQGNSLYNSALAFDQLGEPAEAIRRMAEALRITSGSRIRTPRGRGQRSPSGRARIGVDALGG
jgi:tetratricopeptide (TPR) repeat protein